MNFSLGEYTADKTAVIDSGALIGSGTKIWHFSHISAHAVIGCNCTIGQNVYIGDNAIIGSKVKIQNNVSIYDGVVLEDEVFCGPSVVFTNVYNPRSFIERKHEYRKSIVKKGATLGANCTIVCGVTIGEHAFIGAGAVVNRDVKPYALVLGVPAQQVGWMSQFGERLELPLFGNAICICAHTGDEYALKDGEVTRRGGV